MKFLWQTPDGGIIVNIEASESEGANMLTVETDRGNVYVIDADQLLGKES